MTYRAELSGRALKQMHGLPGPAFDRLIEAMAEVIDYPDDPLRTQNSGSDRCFAGLSWASAKLVDVRKEGKTCVA